MLNIALINPLAPDSNYIPPLGLLIMAAILEQQGYKVAFFDQNTDEDIVRQIRDFRPDIIGLTAVTSAILNAKRLASHLKLEFPNSIIVFGGPHSSCMPHEVISWDEVDYVVVGEGEVSLPMLAQWVVQKGPKSQLDKIPNLFYKNDGVVAFTFKADFLTSEYLNQLPLPAYHLLDMGRMSSKIRHGVFRKGKRVLPYMATRGCPFQCTFCCGNMGHKIRRKRPDLVLDDVEYMVRTFNIDELYLEDDNFTSSKDFALTILNGIVERKLPVSIKFANGVRIDTLNDVLLEKIRCAGGYALSFGLESGSPKVLQLMKKKLDLVKVSSLVSLCKSHGFLMGANMIIGYPGENESDIWASYDYFQSLHLDSIAIVNLIPFPGTAVRTLCEEKNYLTAEAFYWDNYYFDVDDPKILIETDFLSQEQTKDILRKIFIKLYTNPRRIFTLIKNMQMCDIVDGARVLIGKF